MKVAWKFITDSYSLGFRYKSLIMNIKYTGGTPFFIPISNRPYLLVKNPQSKVFF